MVNFFLHLTILICIVKAQNSQTSNEVQLSVTLQENDLDDSITEIFNRCKCVIFYKCDENNFVIPEDQLKDIRVTITHSMRNLYRIRCSNAFYYCCKNKTATTTSTTTTTTTTTSWESSTVNSFYIPKTTSFPNSNTLRCGDIRASLSGRIIEQFPWVVAIYKKKTNNNYIYRCGGSLIHPKLVLTLLHCVDTSTADEIGVVAGKEILRQNYLARVSKIFKHEYSSEDTNDIALLLLRNLFTNIKPVCLPQFNQDFSGRRCTAVGWGGSTSSGSRKLRKVHLPVIDSRRCEDLLRNTSIGRDFRLHPSLLCAGGEEGVDTCKNDGGGPLMCEEEGSYVQVGIVSWGLKCGQKDVPSLYVNVATMAAWIKQKMAEENL